MEKTVYFSHPMAHYNTPFEWECIETILTMLTIGSTENDEISIMSPNQKWLSDLYTNRLKNGVTDREAFEIFKEIARACDIIVGATFLDGALGFGVAEEMREGLRNDKQVYLILVHNGIKLFVPVSDIALPGYAILSRDFTRKRKTDGIL